MEITTFYAMKKNKQTILIIALFLIAILSASCQKTWEQLKKDVQTTDRNYYIEQYSGGTLIATFNFNGTLNSSENSDGVYFYRGDTLIELSGDMIIKSKKK